jgi:Spy/CpxP family protein refolding chaperone
MKTVSILVASAVLLSLPNLIAAEEGGIRFEVRPGANPQGGGAGGLNPFGGGGKAAAAWYIESLEKTVTLSPEQKEKITQIIEARDKAAQEFQAKNAEKLKSATQAMMEAYKAKDKDAIAKAQKEYQDASAETSRLFKQAQTDLENVLTPEQKTKRREAQIAQTIKAVTEPAVLTEEQLTRIKGLLAKGNTGGEREERQWYQSIQEVLTPEQKALVARHRALANARAGFGRANLTADQWQKVEAAYDELAKTPGASSEAITKQLAERVNGLLTEEQKQAMKKTGWPAGAAVGQPGAPAQVIKFGEGGEGISIVINGEGQVAPQGGPGRTVRTVRIGKERSGTEKGPWLGITTEPVSEPLRAQLSLAKGEGLVVGQVVPGSPAAAAGLAQNDILLRLDDQILVELTQLRKLVAMKKPGDQVKLVYLRKAARQEATATLAEHEIESAGLDVSKWLQATPGQPIKIEEGARKAKEGLEQQILNFLKLLTPAAGAPATSEEGGRAAKDGLEQLPQILNFLKLLTPTPGAPAIANPWKRETQEGNLDTLRRQLESSNVPAEAKEKIQRSIDQAKEAADKARAAFQEAMKEAGNLPQGGAAPGAPPNPAVKKPTE